MPLTGQAKTDYQREYMRRRRSNQRSKDEPESVTPEPLDPVRPKEIVLITEKWTPTANSKRLVRPEGISDSQWNYIQYKAEQHPDVATKSPEPAQDSRTKDIG